MLGRRLVVRRLLVAPRSPNASGAVIFAQNPIALLDGWKERAVGFLHKRSSVSSTPHPIVGIDMGHSHLLGLTVERKMERVEISNFFLEPRPNSSEALSAQLKTIFEKQKLSTHGIRTAIKTEGMVIRILNFPQMKKNELASMLHYEVEKYIPFKAGDVVMDFQILGENIQKGDARTMDVVLVAVKQSEINSFISPFQKAGVDLELIDVDAFALSNLLEFIAPDAAQTPVAFLDVGMETSTFGITFLGRPLFIRDISFGGGDILKLLKRKLGIEPAAALALTNESFAKDPQLKAVAEQALASLVNELKLSLGYYMDHGVTPASVGTLYVFGGGFRFLSQLNYLEKEIEIPIKRPDIFSKIHIQPHLNSASLKANEDLLPIALGLCLR